MQQEATGLLARDSGASGNSLGRQAQPGAGAGRKVRGKRPVPKDPGQTKRREVAKGSALARSRYQALSLQWQDKLGNTVSENVLKQAAKYITPEEYDSVVEERAAEELCGYPVCGRSKQKLEQRFSISVAHRKIYDITEQGSYCSRECMAASRFYRHQLTDEPLYMRDQRKPSNIVLMQTDRDEEKAKDIGSVVEGIRSVSISDSTSGERDLMDWYKKTLVAKMNIPDEVAKANPLKIVERESEHVAEDISEAMGRLQFADIEGFEPEFDVKNIKKAIKLVKKPAMVPATAAGRGVGGAMDQDRGEVLKMSFGPKDDDVSMAGSFLSTPAGEETSASEFEKDDDDASDDSGVPGASADNGYFAALFTSELSGYGGGTISSGGAPPLSLFGRMWTLFDRIVTKQTIKYLDDLKKTEDGGQMAMGVADYYCSPGDHSMMMRQRLLSESISVELDTMRGKLRIARDLRHEVRTLVSTLELSSKMAVFKKPEQRLLAVVVLLALARSMDPLREQLEAEGEAAQELERIMKELGTDTGSMRMVSRRLHEPY
ncbi:hypothetical protein H4217_008523 [Coemansia sp. RSA 1939]|nr:hypothetical protein H4217_008523 [Coemansia sp. RSA 1939]KAJ2614955.1 hypothetical protein EV177_001789 [Coemansia sp. RSA 1804]